MIPVLSSPPVRWPGALIHDVAATLFLALLLALPPAPVLAADPPAAKAPATAVATFAGGCFWCMEPPFDAIDGVLSTTSGYLGGKTPQPTYADVSSGGTGHAEAVQIVYDPARVSYETLLVTFWHNIDPTNANGQFCDFGSQYRSAIFVHDATQRRLAEESKRVLAQTARFRGRLATEIVDASVFYPAEDYHQDYYRKNPVQYKFYRYRCGRDEILEELWGKPAPKPG